MNMFKLYIFFPTLITFPFCAQAMRTLPSTEWLTEQMKNKKEENCDTLLEKNSDNCNSANLIQGMKPEKYFELFNSNVQSTLLSRKDRENILDLAQKNNLDLDAATALYFKEQLIQNNHKSAFQKTIQKKPLKSGLKSVKHNLSRDVLLQIRAIAKFKNISFKKAKYLYYMGVKSIDGK